MSEKLRIGGIEVVVSNAVPRDEAWFTEPVTHRREYIDALGHLVIETRETHRIVGRIVNIAAE